MGGGRGKGGRAGTVAGVVRLCQRKQSAVKVQPLTPLPAGPCNHQKPRFLKEDNSSESVKHFYNTPLTNCIDLIYLCFSNPFLQKKEVLASGWREHLWLCLSPP